MKVRAPFLIALQLLLTAQLARAEGWADINYQFETYRQYTCAHGQCFWETHVSPLVLEVQVRGASEESPIPLKFAVLDGYGDTLVERTMGAVWSVGCEPHEHACTMSSTCSIYRSCELAVAIEDGYCETGYEEGDTGGFCGCFGPLPTCPEDHYPHSPWDPIPPVADSVVPPGWETGSLYLSPCGADSPIIPGGSCTGQSTPCYNCDPYSANNGNPINPD